MLNLSLRALSTIATQDINWTFRAHYLSIEHRYHLLHFEKQAIPTSTLWLLNMASWVLGTFKNRSQTVISLLHNLVYKTMVQSRLEYCFPLWNPHKVQEIQTLEAVSCRISSCQNLDYWERLKLLDLLSLQRRRERFTIINCLENPQWQNPKWHWNEVLS